MRLPSLQRFALLMNSGLVLVSLFGLGSFSFGPQMNHEGMGHSTVRPLGCQQKCSSATSPSVTQTSQEVDQKRDKKAGYSYPSTPIEFALNTVSRPALYPSDDFRLLRPPDLLALYSIYRI